jgi:ribose/xylose/arabinose/galactoside ABC-type transport system permease subunit
MTVGSYEVVLVPLLAGGVMIALGVLTGLIAGALTGAANGLFVVRFRVPPFIITLAMMLIARNLALLYRDHAVSPLPRSFNWIGMWGRAAGVPIPVIVMVALAAIAWVVLSRTVYGRQVYAVGGSAEAAHLSGVRVGRVVLSVYVLSGIAAAVAGILEASKAGAGDPNAGELWELNAIAAVVLGGTSLMGGRGTIPGTLLGALIIGVLNNGLRLMGVESFTQGVIKGCVILFAVVLDRMAAE